MTLLSKYKPLEATCIEYVHPWTTSCSDACADLTLLSFERTLKIYAAAYTLGLLMRGRVPTKSDLKKTLLGILQSSAFLTTNGFTYPMFLCFIRKITGNYNILTVSYVPSFLASLAAILLERPSRRNLLCLYVSNEATETVWNMMKSRGIVNSIKYGEVGIFSISAAILMYYYRSNDYLNNDQLGLVSKFVIGPYEGYGYSDKSKCTDTKSVCDNKTKNIALNKIQSLKYLNELLKSFPKHSTCLHPTSCAHYITHGWLKMFSLGLSFQLGLKICMHLPSIVRNPKQLSNILFNQSSYSLAMFLGGFTGMFRLSSCMLRWIFGKDRPEHALPAGIIAGIAFGKYRSNNIALYVMWKMLHISYNIAVQKGIVPEVPSFTIFLYCFSTAILFHAAILEPTNLRPSYWKFLHSLSGGRIASMSRIPMDVWGLGTSDSLKKVLASTGTKMEVRRVFGI